QRDHKRQRAGLHVRGAVGAAALLVRRCEPDRVSRCAEQAGGLRERNTCDPRELCYSLALRPWRQLLQQLPPGPQRARIAEFARIASVALAQTASLLGATANPIRLAPAHEKRRSSHRSAHVQSCALALVVPL